MAIIYTKMLKMKLSLKYIQLVNLKNCWYYGNIRNVVTLR